MTGAGVEVDGTVRVEGDVGDDQHPVGGDRRCVGVGDNDGTIEAAGDLVGGRAVVCG